MVFGFEESNTPVSGLLEQIHRPGLEALFRFIYEFGHSTQHVNTHLHTHTHTHTHSETEWLTDATCNTTMVRLLSIETTDNTPHTQSGSDIMINTFSIV